METETDALRRAAPSWSLADDKRLLDALQKMHDTLLTKCSDTNGQLTTMCTGLTEASLDLDNVNNRFMSLSNSQFVERRVYDDDDVTVPADDVTPRKSTEKPTPTAESTADNIKRALKVLESTHEFLTILADSDSDSGSEGDGDIDRVVLKPKDVYSHRPLPYIIGTKEWKSKWHAGLLPDDSASESEDTDASQHFDKYSDDERYSPESDVKQALPPAVRDRMSTSSSEVISERDIATPADTRSLPTMAPADIAAELARRLQGQPQQTPEPVLEESSPQQVPRKLYKPEKPQPGTVFPDEPPPLESDHEDDIFAELRKNKPYSHRDRVQNVAKDLFGVRGTDDIDAGSEEDGDIFSDLVPGVNKSTPTAHKQSVSTSPMKPTTTNMEPSSPVKTSIESENEQPSNKKPVGGISVFGGGQHSAIGAAILQRQRRAASDDDTDGSDVISVPKQASIKPETKNESRNENTQKDIFEDLFAKSDKVNAKRKIAKDPIVKENVVEKQEKKVDLFSDNLFDDIDDIFTSNVVSKVPIKEAVTKNIEKSLFDDDDDLFRDIAVSNTTAKQDKVAVVNKIITNEKTASIFDSDDDLFTDKPLQKREQNTDKIINSEESNKIIKSGSINDNASETREDAITNTIKDKKSIFDSHEDLFVENKSNTKLVKVAKDIQTSKTNDSKSILDDSDDDIFSDIKVVKSKELPTKSEEIDDKSNIISTANVIKGKSIFEDTNDLSKDKLANINTLQINTAKKDLFSEGDDDLFIIPPKLKIQENLADIDEKHSTQITNNPEMLENKTQVAKKHSVNDILQIQDKESYNTQGQIDILNEPELYKSETKDLQGEEILPEIPKEATQDKLRPQNENVSLDFKIRNSKINVQFYDDDDIFKTDSVTNKKMPVVTPKNIKPEICRKPTLETGSEKSVSEINDKAKKTTNENVTVDSKITNNKINVQFDDDEDIFKIDSVKDKIMPVVTPKDIKPEICRKPTLPTGQEKSVSEKTDNAKMFEKQVDNMKVVDSNKNITSDETKDTPNTSDSKLNTPEIFSEVLNDQPPIFEKPKERKRSKNVNALFDDDSDDEALFYRKSDATLDDVPNIEKKDSLSDDRFQLFLDEPPAIDDDFDQNTNKKNTDSSLEHSDLFKDLSDIKSDDGVIKTSHSIKQVSDEIDSKNIGNVNKVISDIFDDELEFKSKDNKHDLDDELFLPKPKIVEAEQTNIQTKPNQEQTTVTKKVGKLKPMILNINVNSLLPGASPKKSVKVQEQTDGQIISTNSTEDLHSKTTTDDKEIKPSLVKSVSFDGDPDSEILDNKLSKERAKIKVKRRPSSRRARHEAARISGIDFGQGSTDNSSSVDDILKSTDVTDTSHTTTENKEENMDSITCDSLAEDIDIREENIDIVTNEIASEYVDYKNDDNVNKQIDNNDKITEVSLIKPEPVPHVTPSQDVKSKVVYILNDEDIFNDAKQPKSPEVVTKPKILNIVDDDDDIFKTITPATKAENVEIKPESPAVKTLGNVYKNLTEDSDDDIFKDKQNFKKVAKPKETKRDLEKIEVKTADVKQKQEKDKTKPKTSIFDDLSDEENELFNTRTKQKLTLPQKELSKNALFDSDSDSELFSGKSKKQKGDVGAVRKKEMKRVEVKGSLFGDDDEDDIFGANSKKTASSLDSSSTSSRKESGVQPESRSSDPLSALFNPK